MELQDAQTRLAQIAADLDNLPQTGLHPGDVAVVAGRWLDEALDLGALPDRPALRARLALEKSRDPEEWPHWAWVVTVEALLPKLSARGMSGWTEACKPIAAMIQEDADAEADERQPPLALLAKLSKQQQAIITFLWSRDGATMDEMHKAVWGDDCVENATVEQAVRRLNDRLLQLGYRRTTIEHSGGFFALKRA
jgi:hypothetical protein